MKAAFRFATAPRRTASRCTVTRVFGLWAMLRATWLVAGLVATGLATAGFGGDVLADAAPGGEPRPSEAEIGETQVYATPDESVREIFEGTESIDTLLVFLSADEKERLRERTGSPVPSDTVLVRIPRDAGGALLGYAVVAEEIGKYRPITFLVGTDPAMEVAGVDVLVYRESRGGEVRKSRFLRQYRGKSDDDPIRINRDILNIAGATLSVRALNHGVRRVLTTLELLSERGAFVGQEPSGSESEQE